MIEATREMVATSDKAIGMPWTQAYQKREAARHITENLKRNQVAHNTTANAAVNAAQPAAEN